MADLSGRTAERGLKASLRLLLALALTGTGFPAPVNAQEAPPQGPPRAGATLEGGFGLTSIHGEAATLLRGMVLLSRSSRLAFGGGGGVLVPDRSLGGDPVFPDRKLGFGYGGVVVEVAGPRLGASTATSLRALVGAGNVDLRDRASGARLGSDNVFVTEPEVTVRRRLSSRLYMGASLSYRVVTGLNDIDDVEAEDLGGFSLGIHLRIGPL